MIDSLWRIELLHPLTVHFPVALIGLLVGLECVRFVQRERRFLTAVIALLSVPTVLSAWIAYWSGSEAESVVNRIICDPGVTHEHGDWAWKMSWICTGFAFVALFRLYRAEPLFLRVLALSLALTGGYTLFRTGHLGARLVYELGAGVHMPSADCREYSDASGGAFYGSSAVLWEQFLFSC